jgi:outer membrane protein OmpA-like peptidoglycan-associated protein
MSRIFILVALLLLTSNSLADDRADFINAIKKQFPDAQFYEKDVEGGEGGSIRLIFPVVEASDMPATIEDLDRAESGNALQDVKVIPDLSFVQNSSSVSKKDSKQLDELAKALLLHPEVRKVRIDVYGKKQQMATKRASELCKYLSERGISDGRCETRSLEDSKEQVLKFFLLKE